MPRIYVNDKPYRVPKEIAEYMDEGADLIAELREEVRKLRDEKSHIVYDDVSVKMKAYIAGEDAGANFLQPCGHPLGCITREPNSTTQFCQWCADKAEIRRLYSLLRQWKDESEGEDNRDLDRGEGDDE